MQCQNNDLFLADKLRAANFSEAINKLQQTIARLKSERAEMIEELGALY
jgi:hypothetical protein